MEHIYDIIVIGGGPGGYTSALYAARSGFDTVVIEKMSAGGQMIETSQIDNYPGFDEGIDGFALSQKMKSGAERFGAKTVFAEVVSLDLKGDVKKIETSSGEYYAKAVIVATGATHKKLGIDKEDEYRGRGLSYCATCDGNFYRGRTVAVVGGGNSAVCDALVLSRICKRVILIHRRDKLRATKIYHTQLMKAGNVEFRWNSSIQRLLGEERLLGIEIKDLNTGELSEIAVDGLFVAIGREPVTDLLLGQLTLDASGYVIADETARTNIPGVFAVGDVRAKALRQVITAASDGANGAYSAEEYLMSLK